MHNDDGDDALSSSLTSQRRHQFSLYHEKIRIKQQTIKVVHILKKVMIYAHTQTHHCFFTTHSQKHRLQDDWTTTMEHHHKSTFSTVFCVYTSIHSLSLIAFLCVKIIPRMKAFFVKRTK